MINKEIINIEIPNNVNKLYISGIISEALMNAPAICFYDENQTYISGESYSNRNNFYFNIPSNAKYFRTSYRNVYTDFSIIPTNSYEINLGKNLFNKNNVLKFIEDYNVSKDIEKLFDDYEIDSEIKKEFFSTFDVENYPLIQIISDENYEDILKVSKEMRNNIRGEDIGGLG